MRSDAPTIEVRGLSKRYGHQLVVDDLTFTVRPGTVTGFLGPNGAGKSTTLRMILGLDHPTGGTATIGGVPYARLSRPMLVVGALLDAGAVHPGRSAHDHLLQLAQTQLLPPGRVAEVLAEVGLSEVAHDRAGRFSLGMGQRLGLAAALLGDPAVLVLDEPVNGLDPDGILWIRDLLTRQARRGRTVLVSSHLLGEMALTAEDLVVIAHGRLVAACTTAEFIGAGGHASVLFRCPDVVDTTTLGALLTADGGAVSAGPAGALLVVDRDATRVGALAAGAGLALAELTPQHASLEDAFLERTHATSAR